MSINENENPNTKLTPYYEGENLRWVSVVEYYALLASTALEVMWLEDGNDEESHTA